MTESWINNIHEHFFSLILHLVVGWKNVQIYSDFIWSLFHSWNMTIWKSTTMQFSCHYSKFQNHKPFIGQRKFRGKSFCLNDWDLYIYTNCDSDFTYHQIIYGKFELNTRPWWGWTTVGYKNITRFVSFTISPKMWFCFR